MDKLRSILKNDWNIEPDEKELHKIARDLVGMGDLLLKLFFEDAQREGLPFPSYYAKPNEPKS